MRIFSFFASLVFIFIITLVLSSVALAQVKPIRIAATPTPTPSSVYVGSYELFWPLAAGRTEGDSLYSLKLFKEKVQGFFIFTINKKADYAVLLGTKRVLEAEKLIISGKTDLAEKALEKAVSQFSSAYNYIKNADSEGKFIAKEIRRDRLINVKILIDYLKTVSPPEIHPALDAVKEKANAIPRDYLP